jgi:sodium/bile acid cotransporter 7
MGVPLINVLYSTGDPGTVGVLSTPLLLYHVEQLILGNIEVELLKKWVTRGEKRHSEPAPPRDEEDDMYDSELIQASNNLNTNSHMHAPSPLSQLHTYKEK